MYCGTQLWLFYKYTSMPPKSAKRKSAGSSTIEDYYGRASAEVYDSDPSKWNRRWVTVSTKKGTKLYKAAKERHGRDKSVTKTPKEVLRKWTRNLHDVWAAGDHGAKWNRKSFRVTANKVKVRKDGVLKPNPFREAVVKVYNQMIPKGWSKMKA